MTSDHREYERRIGRAEARAKATAAMGYGPLQLGVPWDVGLRILGYSVPRNPTWGDVIDTVEKDMQRLRPYTEPMMDEEATP